MTVIVFLTYLSDVILNSIALHRSIQRINSIQFWLEPNPIDDYCNIFFKKFYRKKFYLFTLRPESAHSTLLLQLIHSLTSLTNSQ